MADFLTKFQSQNRRKIAIELVNKWAGEASYHGDKKIRSRLSNARRTSTCLLKVLDLFSNLSPEHQLSINGAANSLKVLISELESVSPWAKEYHKFCVRGRNAEAAIELEALAQSRWGSDSAALAFEYALMNELVTREGAATFCTWAQIKHSEAVEIICSIQSLEHGATPREVAARTVAKNLGYRGHEWAGKVFSSWGEYEAYLSHRKAVASMTKRIIQMANE